MKYIQPGPILVHRDDIKNMIDALRLARIAEPGTDEFERGFTSALNTIAVAFGIEEMELVCIEVNPIYVKESCHNA